MTEAIYTFASVFVVSVISFAGVLILWMQEKHLKKVLLFLVPLAVGALLGDAFFHLIPEAFQESERPEIVSLLIVGGILLFFFLEKLLRWHHQGHEEIEGAGLVSPAEDRTFLGRLVLLSDGLHNFIDGIIIGASFLAGTEIGIATTLAVVLHEIPQEIGDFGVLVHSGYEKKKALFYNFLSALTAFAGAALALILGVIAEEFLKFTLPLMAGMFIYIALADLLPELQKNRNAKIMISEGLALTIGLLIMYLLIFLE
jgi:zinc and cadmium transporter